MAIIKSRLAAVSCVFTLVKCAYPFVKLIRQSSCAYFLYQGSRDVYRQKERSDDQIQQILEGIDAWEGEVEHTVVFLTKNAHMAERFASEFGWRFNRSWFLGLTVRTQQEADAKLPILSGIKGNLWLSLEPLWGSIDKLHKAFSACKHIKGVIVGHDNRGTCDAAKDVLDGLGNIRSVVRQCQDAGIPVYVKQLWTYTCDGCGRSEHDPDSGCHGEHNHSLRMTRLPERFPSDLQFRNLPWSMPGGVT